MCVCVCFIKYAKYLVTIFHSSVCFLQQVKHYFQDGRTTIMSWSAKLGVLMVFFFVHYTNYVCGSSIRFRWDLGEFRVNRLSLFLTPSLPLSLFFTLSLSISLTLFYLSIFLFFSAVATTHFYCFPYTSLPFLFHVPLLFFPVY